MSYCQLPSGAYHARLMINGVRYTATLPTCEDAEDWETIIRAKAVSGSLPRRISVRDYAARWMSTYDTAPTSTHSFHQGNLDRYILRMLGSRSVADVTPDRDRTTDQWGDGPGIGGDGGCRLPDLFSAVQRRRRRRRHGPQPGRVQAAPTQAPARSAGGPRAAGGPPAPAASQELASRHCTASARARRAGRRDRGTDATRCRPTPPTGHDPTASLPRNDPGDQEPPHARPRAAGHDGADPGAADRCRRRRPTHPLAR